MFACVKVNHNSKIDNILAISKELSLSTRNMLFIDDSTYETEAVKVAIPDIKVIRFDIYRWEQQQLGVLINRLPDWETIQKRHQYYCNSKLLLQKNLEEDEVLLNSRIEIFKAQENEYGRISELKSFSRIQLM